MTVPIYYSPSTVYPVGDPEVSDRTADLGLVSIYLHGAGQIHVMDAAVARAYATAFTQAAAMLDAAAAKDGAS